MLTALLVGALALPLTTPAEAASSYSVTIPQHPVPASLTLLGASADGVAVQQGAVTDDSAVSPIFTGPEGTELKVRPQLGPTVTSYPRTVLAVVDETLTWYEHVWRVGSQPKEAHRMNLLTGEDLGNDGMIAAPGAFNGESWFSDAVLGHTDYPSNWQRPLRQYHAGTAGRSGDGTMITDILIPNVQGISGVAMAADKTAVLRATMGLDHNGAEHYYLDLVNLRSKAVDRLLDSIDVISRVALTKDTIVWVSRPAGERIRINQRPRTGGATTSYSEPSWYADAADLVAGDAGVAYLVTDPGDPDDPNSSPNTVLRIVNSSTAHEVALPYGGFGLAAVGDRFLTATGGTRGGNPAVAGVYSIRADTVSRVATVPNASLPPQQWSFSAGNFRYTDRSEPTEPGMPVWERTVSGTHRATFSTERRLARTSGSMAFSAGRGVVGSPDQNGVWQLLDRGEVTAEIEALGTPNVSGPYTLIGGKMFRPDGEHIYTEPTPDGLTSGGDDLFGSRVIYTRIGGDGQAAIWLDDAEAPSPTKLDTIPAGCYQGPEVSIWGELAAWASTCGDRITVRNLRTNLTRVVPTSSDTLTQLFLSEGTLTWIDDEDHVLDLTSPTSVPATLASLSGTGKARLIAIDDHRVARDVAAYPRGLSRDLQMSPLPFSPKYAPRLISKLAPGGFSPDGDGQRDTWAPQFDITKPLRSATVKITNYAGTRTLAILAADAPDGSVRGLSWNGLSSSGAQLAAGTYRWTLTGRAEDGDGTLIAADGSPSVTGTVEINLP